MPFIFPLCVPQLYHGEAALVMEAVQSGQIGPAGHFRDMVEPRLASLFGSRHALTTSSGTTALHLAIDLAGAGPGDEVIVPSLTYVATANAVRHTGARPVFADVDPETWCLDPQSVERHITPRTRGIVTVHLFGNVAPMAQLREMADRHGLWLVADAAQAALSRVEGKGVGTLTEMSTFSFHLNKTITCGEGGALTINDPALFEAARIRRSHGMDWYRRHVFHEVGYNYRLSNLHCAVLVAQLDGVVRNGLRRNAVIAAYRAALADAPVTFQPRQRGVEADPWLFNLVLPKSVGRDAVISALAEAAVEARPFFPSLHRMPFHLHGPPETLPVTERLSAQGISLPCHEGMEPADAEVIAAALRKILDRALRSAA